MSDTATQYDPADHNADDVVAHLESIDTTTDEGAAEFGRILQAERDGKARVTITDHAYPAPEPVEPEPEPEPVEPVTDTTTPRDAQGRPLSTSAATFAEAAKVATPAPVGVVGVSPEAERTGRRDKGLSQANPAILSGGPVPDARSSVDDTAALDALAALEG